MIGADALPTADRVWRLPYELALACTSSAMRLEIARRRAIGDLPLPLATIIPRGYRLFAIVDFEGEGRPGVLFALDVWLDPK